MCSSLVLIVDDAPVRLAAFEQALANTVGVVTSLSGAEPVLALLEHLIPDALVLNRDVPGADDILLRLALLPAAGGMAVVTFSPGGNLPPARLPTWFRRSLHPTQPLSPAELTAAVHRLLGRVSPGHRDGLQRPHYLSAAAGHSRETADAMAGLG